MDGSVDLKAPRLAGDAPPPARTRWSLRRVDDTRNPMPTMLQAALRAIKGTDNAGEDEACALENFDLRFSRFLVEMSQLLVTSWLGLTSWLPGAYTSLRG